MKRKLLIFSLAVVVFGFQSCKKDAASSSSDSSTTTSLTTNLKAAVASVVSTQATDVSSEDIQSATISGCSISDSIGAADSIGHKHGGGRGHGDKLSYNLPEISSCATVTVSGTSYPKTITIDFGTGCTDHKGHLKSGQIIIEVSDTIINAGATSTITYKDYYVDSVKVDLSAVLKNLGQNDSGRWVIANSYTQTTVKDSVTTVETNADTIEWVSGFATSTKSDDIYYKTGSGSITVDDSVTYSRKITKALLIDKSCHYILSGTIELIKNGSTIITDYGDGTCDSVATVTTNGSTEEIDLSTQGFKEGGNFDKHSHRGKR